MSKNKQPGKSVIDPFVLDKIEEGYFETDFAGNLTIVNKSLCRITGYKSNELVGMNNRDYTAPETAKKMYEKFSLAYETGKSIEIADYEVIMKGGKNISLELSASPIRDDQNDIIGFRGIVREITEKKRSEQLLKESEARFSRLSEASFEGVAITEAGIVVDVNDQIALMLGYEPQEMIGTSVQNYIAPESQDIVKRKRKEESELPYEHMALRKDGSTFPVEVRAKSMPFEGRTFRVTVIRDISERKKAEEALRQSETMFRAIFENSIDAIGVSKEGLQVNVNPMFLKLFGFSNVAEMHGKPILDIIAPSEHPRIMENMKRRAKGKEVPSIYETRGIRKDGTEFDLSVHISSYELEGDNYSLAILRDITDRKQAEKELRESENKFSKIFSTSPNVITISSLNDGRFIDINESGAKKVGYTRDELIGKTSIELGLIRPKDRDRLVRILKEDGFYSGIKLTVTTKGGEEKIGLFHGQIIQLSGENYLFQTLVDITERKQTEEALIDSEERYRLLFENAPDAYFISNLKGKTIDANIAIETLLGLNKQEIVGKNFLKLGLLAKSQLTVATKLLASVIAGKPFEQNEYTIIRKDGSKVEADLRMHRIKIRDKTHILGIVRDITKRKQAITDLKLSNSLNLATLESTADGILVVNHEGKITGYNQRFQKLWCIPDSIMDSGDDERAIKYVLKQLVDSKGFLDKVLELYKTPESKSFDTLKFKDGRVFERYSRPQKLGKEVIGRVWSFRDVTKQVEAIESLKDNEERLKILFESAPDAYYISDLKGTFVDGNFAAETLMGYKKDELIEKSFLELNIISKNQIEKAGKLLAQNVMGKATGPDEFTLKRKDGSKVIVEIRTHPVKISGKTRILGIAHDVTKRKIAEDELRESARLLKESQRVANLGSYVIDITADTWTSSDILDDIFGIGEDYKRDTNRWINLVHPEQRDEMLEYFRNNVLKEHQRFDREYRIIRLSDNEERWVHGLGELEFDSNGNPIKMTGNIQDITKRKQTEQELIKLSSAVTQSPVSVIITDIEGNIEYVNPKFSEVSGYSYEDVKGKNPRLLKSGETQSREYKKMWDSITSGKTWIGDFHNKKKNGELFWESASISPIINKAGEISNYLAVKEDITVRKQFEEDLYQTHQRLQSHVENTPLGFIEWDLEFKVNAWNNQAEQIFGWSGKEAFKKSAAKLVIPNHEAKHIEQIWQSLLSDKGGEHSINDNKTKNGLLIRCEWFNTPIYSKDGKLMGVASMVRDITAQEQLEKERDRALTEAQNANEVKSLFIANMSHEIRTPLNAILGFSDLIQERVSEHLNPDMEHYFELLQSSGERLMKTVHNILDISQIEAGTIILNPEDIDISKVILDLLEEQKNTAQEKGLKLELESHVRNTMIHTDRYCVSQALTNLIENAIKYTDKGSVKVALVRDGKKLTVSVVDTGIGMSQDYMDRMFEPFSQESEGYSKQYQGAGLGLSLTKRYCDLIAVNLEVESEKEKGSKFTLKFD
jgi:PAS domain S-box-containing protein